LIASGLAKSTVVPAVSLGVHAVSNQGKDEGYLALVVGVSNYEYWPKLPYARDDAGQVFEEG